MDFKSNCSMEQLHGLYVITGAINHILIVIIIAVIVIAPWLNVQAILISQPIVVQATSASVRMMMMVLKMAKNCNSLKECGRKRNVSVG